jgi:uncharacterized protein DUF4178
VSLSAAGPSIGDILTIDGHRWSVTERATYRAASGASRAASGAAPRAASDVQTIEWACERSDLLETSYLLREETDAVRWFFAHPLPLSALTLSGDRPAEHALAELTIPPDALIYRGRAHGFEESMDGEYTTDGDDEATRKTTWDYWDATHTDNIAIERWPDGTIECYHSRAIDPSAIPVVSTVPTIGKLRSGIGGALTFLIFVALFVLAMQQAVEPVLTLGLAVTALIALIVIAVHSPRLALPWLGGLVVLALVFSRFPPLTSVPGLAGLILAPAIITRWITMQEPGAPRLVLGAAVAVASATLVAGLTFYYRFAPAPRSLGQYMLAVGPAPIAGVVAALIAFLVVRAAAR